MKDGAFSRSFPSYLVAQFQNGSSYETIHVKMLKMFILNVHSSFSYKSNSFSCKRFRTRTRFETEARGNSEMVFSVIIASEDGAVALKGD